MMRTKPNFKKSRIVATQALADHGIKDFPIDILSILKSYDDIKIISYSEMARKRNCSLEKIIEVNQSEDGVIHYCGKRDKYLIAYNDNVAVKERVYWTLAHEFGHYLLKHHKETEKASLYRNELGEHEYEVFETEANFFSRFFISPPEVIVESGLNNYEKVMNFFGVSYTAANNTLRYIENSLKKGFKFSLPNRLFNYLNGFIFKAKHGCTCINCETFFYFKGSLFCPICGSSDINDFYKGADFKMHYPGVRVDELSRAISCPNCQNDDVKGDHCQICGLFLVNRCSGETDDIFIDNVFQEPIRDWSQQCGCESGAALDGNARYCPYCGCVTTFHGQNFFDNWKDEKERMETITDADLPF